MAANYVEVLVKSRDEAKPDLDGLKARLDELKKTVAEARATVDTADGAAKLDRLTVKLDELSRKASNPKISMTGAIKTEADIHAVEASLDKLSDKSVDVDTTKARRSLSSLVDRGGEAGDQTGGSFMGRFGEWLKPSKFQMVTTGLSSALAMLPALGAVAGTGLVLGLGAKVASGIPSVQKEFSKLGDVATKTLDSAVKPMLPVINQLATQLGGFVKSIGPQLKDLFAAAAPAIMPLAHGLEGLVSGLLPGLLAIVKAAQPAIAAFAGLLSNLGGNLGKMFSAMAPAVAASATVLSAFGKIINAILPVLGTLGGALAKTLAPAIGAFATALASLAPVIGVVGKILGQLAGAVLGSLSGALEALASLIEGIAPSFTVLATVAGQVFNIMENSGVFGVLEDSLESLAGPLAKFINALVSGLAPILPQIIALIVRLLNDGVVVLTGGILDLITGLTPLIPALVRLAPIVLAIVAAFKMWAIAQAVLTAVMDMSPFGLIAAAIAAVIIVTVEIIKHWQEISSVAKTAFRAVKDAVMDAFDWVKSHWPLLLMILIGPIALAVGYIVQHWRQIGEAAAAAWHDVVNATVTGYQAVVGFFKTLGSDIASITSSAYHAVVNFFVRMGTDIGHAAETAVHNLIGWFEWARDGLHNSVSAAVDDVVHYFEALPGRILGALGSLARDLYNVGANIIGGLRQGLDHAVGGLLSDVKGVGGDIVGGFKSALSIFSPSRRMDEEVGQPIMAGATQGMKKGLAGVVAVARQAGQMAIGGMQAGARGGFGAAAIGGMQAGARGGFGAAGSGSGSAGTLTLEVLGTGTGLDQVFITWLKSAIRARAGGGPNSVQKALGWKG